MPPWPSLNVAITLQSREATSGSDILGQDILKHRAHKRAPPRERGRGGHRRLGLVGKGFFNTETRVLRMEKSQCRPHAHVSKLAVKPADVLL